MWIILCSCTRFFFCLSDCLHSVSLHCWVLWRHVHVLHLTLLVLLLKKKMHNTIGTECDCVRTVWWPKVWFVAQGLVCGPRPGWWAKAWLVGWPVAGLIGCPRPCLSVHIVRLLECLLCKTESCVVSVSLMMTIFLDGLDFNEGMWSNCSWLSHVVQILLFLQYWSHNK